MVLSQFRCRSVLVCSCHAPCTLNFDRRIFRMPSRAYHIKLSPFQTWTHYWYSLQPKNGIWSIIDFSQHFESCVGKGGSIYGMIILKGSREIVMLLWYLWSTFNWKRRHARTLCHILLGKSKILFKANFSQESTGFFHNPPLYPKKKNEWQVHEEAIKTDLSAQRKGETRWKFHWNKCIEAFDPVVGLVCSELSRVLK